MSIPAAVLREPSSRLTIVPAIMVRACVFAACLLGLLCGIPSMTQAQDPEPAAEKEAPMPDQNPFPGRFQAPDLDGGTEWLNTTGPISMKELRGKIVLLDFWTYCCINCMHILPDLKYLEQKYPNQLVVIGVHHPKFDNEHDTDNIREAILRYEIEHPVVNDSSGKIGQAFQFSSWPTLVLIDPEGKYVGHQPGEGNRELFDNVIAKMITYHRAKGTLDETPVSFHLEREKQAPTPLRYPGKVLADEAGKRLFISDSNNNRLVISSLDGQLIDTIGTGAMGKKDGSYAEAEFDHPQGMSLVGETLYVADTENHLLRAVDLKAKKVTTIAGIGEQARGRLTVDDGPQPALQTPLNSPWALQHLDGMLYICMAGPHQLWAHKPGSDTVQVYAGTGREDIIDDILANCALAQPSGITTDGKHLFLVDSEGSAVRRVTLGDNGDFTTVVGPHDLARGRSLFEFGDIDGSAAKARLQHPLEVLYHDGQLFVADTYNHKIKLVNAKTGETTTWLGTGKRGRDLQSDSVQLSEPAGLTIVGEELIIADTNNHRLVAANLKTKAVREVAIAGLKAPTPPKAVIEDKTPVTELPAQTVKAGKTTNLSLAFELPEGFKLNKLAPLTVQWQAISGDAVVDAAVLATRQRLTADGLTASTPVALAAGGAGVYQLTISYSFCRDGTGGVCRFGKVKYQLPLTVADDGAEAIELKIQEK